MQRCFCLPIFCYLHPSPLPPSLAQSVPTNAPYPLSAVSDCWPCDSDWTRNSASVWPPHDPHYPSVRECHISIPACTHAFRLHTLRRKLRAPCIPDVLCRITLISKQLSTFSVRPICSPSLHGRPIGFRVEYLCFNEVQSNALV
jgi:hypothetical protein